VWNAKYIEQVQIVLSEEIGVGTRGKFYDKYGALKDVLQNHMLQLLALTAMEQPKTMRSDTIREEKARVLEAVKPVRTVLGQYGGYRKEKDVKSSSSTETLAAVEARVHTKRWKDVPFYLLTGKKLKKKQTSIYIQFKNTACKLFEGVCPLKPNHLVIQIQPDEGFYMVLNGRAPGGGLVPVKMDFCHKCTFGPNAPEAYENVFRNVLKGDQTSFVRSDEVESSWKFIESIHKTAPHTYTHLPPKEAELTSWFLL
jgi:glucose-6-phosphate 1-dehydrogenase